jgi:hypothetical protein
MKPTLLLLTTLLLALLPPLRAADAPRPNVVLFNLDRIILP